MAVLSPGTGSVTPAGGATVAVFTIDPVSPGGTVPVTEKVAVAPEGNDTSASMLPAPDPVPHVPAPLVQVQVKPPSGAGSTSCTRAFVTSLGPALVTTIV